MSETNQTAVQETAVAPVDTIGAPAGLHPDFDPFDDGAWESQPGEATEPAAPADPATTYSATAEPPVEPAASENIVDADAYLKETLGFDNWDAAKLELETLRKNASTPAEIKFANEQSEKLFLALKEGKEDDIYSYLSRKKELERVSKLEVSKPEDAEQVLKTSLKYRHPELSADEVDHLFKMQHPVPPKPVQRTDQSDEEYESSLSLWQQQVEQAQKGMVIQAKLAKPELAKITPELVLPDIPQATPKPAEPSQEELAQLQQIRDAYLQDVSKGLNDLKGYNVEYKDEEVKLNLNYEITPEEKAKLKPIMESLATDISYLQNRWANPDGTYNAKLMAEDLYLLENKEKVFQKFANESASQRLAHKIKADSNIDLNASSPQRTYNPESHRTEWEKAEDYIWDNS